jgi:hypothetical protein
MLRRELAARSDPGMHDAHLDNDEGTVPRDHSGRFAGLAVEAPEH